MSSYHSSFNYLKKNSSGEGFIVASFEPDSGFVDTYLGMDQVIADSYDGVEKFLYGNKYNTQPTISITLIKPDGSDITMAENRAILRWLTGYRQASWLDLYVGENLTYSFLGNFTSVKQQKLDARVIGIQAVFTSVSPWAWSVLKKTRHELDGDMFEVNDDGDLIFAPNQNSLFGELDANGVLTNPANKEGKFYISSTDIIHNNIGTSMEIDNPTDDLYTYINLGLVFNNEGGDSITISNQTLNEDTVITGMSPNETITLTSTQIITSSIPTKIFGDNFNFVWPRLAPGLNQFVVDGATRGSFDFTHRYPMKVGDCAIDVDTFGINPMLEGKVSGVIGSVDGIDIIGRENITLTDIYNEAPYEVSVVDSYLAIIEATELNKNRSFDFVADKVNNTMNQIIINNNKLYISFDYEGNVEDGRECVIFVDKSTNLPYKIIAKDGSLYISETYEI